MGDDLMSMADLHDLAATLHQQEELLRRDGSAGPGELPALRRAVLQLVREVTTMDERLSALEKA